MKKILVLLILTLSIGCEKEEPPVLDNEIIGTWQWKASILPREVEGYEDGDYYNVQEYKFYSNNSYESIMYFFNDDNDKIEGYHSKEIGTYKIKGDTLIREYDQYYSNSTIEYEVVPPGDLKLFQQDLVIRHFYDLDADSILIFNFDDDYERLNPAEERKFIRIN